MSQNTREIRISSFREFRDKAESIFKTFSDGSPEYKMFEDRYMLTVCPKGRNGGIDDKLCEVFYGSSIYDEERSISSNLKVKQHFLFETGASLAFDLLDDGYVLVTLYLPYTERMKPLISAVILDRHMKPQNLTRRKLRTYWHKLNLSMLMYSLAGAPTWRQRFRWNVWLPFKQTLREGVLQEKHFFRVGKSVMKYVLTVGLSGFLIYMFTVFPTRTETKVECLLEHILEQSKIRNQKIDSALIQIHRSASEDTIVRDTIVPK